MWNLIDVFQQLDLEGRTEAGYHLTRLLPSLERLADATPYTGRAEIELAHAYSVASRLASTIGNSSHFEFERHKADTLDGDCDPLIDPTRDH